MIAQGASGSGKFIVAPISFEVLPQLKTASFTDRVLRRCVNEGKQIWFLTVPSGCPLFYLLRFERLATKGRMSLRVDIRLRKKKDIGKRMLAVTGTLETAESKAKVNG